ncbi:nitroreductase [Malaciobacter molluscorum LMG 25693]|uniref:Nitroreductase n=1 Tax=Malaciobacter molluscorum LMG 25693 TaxID=870501 RepID=A0A2G1DEW7_9BACT|nr:nitroreductase family protein [Malaciobacter molluscorum]AXX92784.1 nitroreductase family protein [Malaciobacter molluscorum LMG 25693]PHO17021.1 nitroreductase [Malaciobacter molluscorum LMG 25693]
MNYKDLKQLVNKSRCTRRFKQDVQINSKDLEELIDVARVTSSAKNMQPLKYILVTNEEMVKALATTAKWAAHLTNWTQTEDEIPSAFIIMLNDKNIDGFAMFDAGVSFEAISLAANAKNLDICALASIDKDICKDLFEIEDNYEILIGIAIGISSETIKIVDVEGENTNYYRDEQDQHCVPKRALQDIIIGTYK